MDLYSRTGELRLELAGFNTYFGTGSDLPNTIDLVSSERRPSVLADVKAYARLCDCLENLDFVMSMAQASDVPMRTSDRHSFLAMMENTVKPMVYTVWDTAGLEDIVRMAELVAGGTDRLAEKPFMLAYLEPTSPLVHSEEVLAKMFALADKGLPFVYAPGPIEGASAPVTSAGSLAMANAECLSGLAIAQLRHPGTPVVFGSGSGPLDMKTTVGTYSSPEFMHHCLGMAELAHHRYKLPVWGFSGCSDSKLPDIQAGIDSALWILWTALSGANLVHDLGYIEAGLTGSFEMVVVAEEIVSYVRRLMSGIEVSPSTLAVDVIDEVGPGGNFLSTAHTLQHFRSVWQPSLFDRNNSSRLGGSRSTQHDPYRSRGRHRSHRQSCPRGAFRRSAGRVGRDRQAGGPAGGGGGLEGRSGVGRLGSMSPLARSLMASAWLCGATGGLIAQTPQFRDSTRSAGLEVVTWSGSVEKPHILESTGNGVMVLDYDGDGFQDLFFVSAFRLPRRDDTAGEGNVLYRNLGDGTFEDVDGSGRLGAERLRSRRVCRGCEWGRLAGSLCHQLWRQCAVSQ